MNAREYKVHINTGNTVSFLEGVIGLLPCPFCGEESEIELMNTYTASCWVECANCGAEAHGEAYSYKTSGRQTLQHYKMAIESARQAWNRRTA